MDILKPKKHARAPYGAEAELAAQLDVCTSEIRKIGSSIERTYSIRRLVRSTQFERVTFCPSEGRVPRIELAPFPHNHVVKVALDRVRFEGLHHCGRTVVFGTPLKAGAR
jgi:hypothetical protein